MRNVYAVKVLLALFLVVGFHSLGFTQGLSSEEEQRFQQEEDSLCVLVDSLRGALVLDERINYNYQFIKRLKETLSEPNAYKYPFKKLQERMHIIVSPDDNFKIFNWVVVSGNFKKTYFGAILMPDGRLIPLLDYSEQLEESGEPQRITHNKEWYGAEYYHIMKDNAFGNTVYLLFGFNSNSAKFNRKLIDVLSIKNGTVQFGLPIFKAPDLYLKPALTNRFIQYYKKNASTMLNWDATVNMIVFNRLESEVSAPSRLDTYIPAGPIDGLKKEGDMWEYQQAVHKILKLGDGNAPVDGVMK